MTTVTEPAGATSPSSTPPRNLKVASFLGFAGPKPATWRWQPPQGPMRAANYVLPARSGENQAHLVVFKDIGGGKEMNIDRWRGQFRSPDGLSVDPTITALTVQDVPVTIVELTGAYKSMRSDRFKPNQSFLAAIVEAPEGTFVLRLTGQRETVVHHRAAFLTLVKGLRRDEARE